MTLEEAQKVLSEESDAWRCQYIDTESFRGEIVIDGAFTLAQVEALAVIAQEKRRREAPAMIE